LRKCLVNQGIENKRLPDNTSSYNNRPIGYWTKRNIFKALEVATREYEEFKGRKPNSISEVNEFLAGGLVPHFIKIC
jgi:hypothetical protein